MNDVNEVPTDLFVSASTFDEHIAAGSIVGRLSSADQDSGDTFTYSLVDGNGGADNNRFSINGDQLMVVDSPDFEDRDTYSIRVQTKDSGGMIFERSLVLSVNYMGETANSEPTPASAPTPTPEPISESELLPESSLELVSGKVNGRIITLDFNEELGGTRISRKKFKVTVNNKKIKIKSAELFPKDGYIEIDLKKQPRPGDDVRISYKDSKGDQLNKVIQDGFGNDFVKFKKYSLDIISEGNSLPDKGKESVEEKRERLQREFEAEVEDYLDQLGIDLDYDLTVKEKEASFSSEYLGFDADIIVKTREENDWNETSEIRLDLEYYSEEVSIIWKFDDIVDAASSLEKSMESGGYYDALEFLEDGNIEEFNDFIEELNGFDDSKIIVNGRGFN